MMCVHVMIISNSLLLDHCLETPQYIRALITAPLPGPTPYSGGVSLSFPCCAYHMITHLYHRLTNFTPPTSTYTSGVCF